MKTEVVGDSAATSFDPTRISRPDRALLRHFLIVSLLTGPAFPFVFLPMLFKYETLRYRFENDGVSMSWGWLFRREIHLTYRRIQDIHLSRGLIQRWLGLATVEIQTASGSAGAEMSIEGILEAEALRDYLYTTMRGVRTEVEADIGSDSENPPSTTDQEALVLLRDIRDSLQSLAAGRKD